MWFYGQARKVSDVAAGNWAWGCVGKGRVGMALQPSVVLLVGVESVENDRDLPDRECDDFVP